MRRKDYTFEEARIGRLIQSLDRPAPAPDAEFLNRLRETTTAAFLESHRHQSSQLERQTENGAPANLDSLESSCDPAARDSVTNDCLNESRTVSVTDELNSPSATTALMSQTVAHPSRPMPAIEFPLLGRNRLGRMRVLMVLMTAVLLAIGFLPDSLVPSRGARLQVAFDILARANSAEIEVKNGEQSSLLLVAQNESSWAVKQQFPSGNAEVTDNNGTYFFNYASNTIHVMPPAEADQEPRPAEKLLDNLNVADNSLRYALLRQRPRAKVVQNGQTQWLYEFQQVDSDTSCTVNVNATVDATTNELLTINSVLRNPNGEIAFRGEANIVSLNQDISEERFQVADPSEEREILANVAFVESIEGNPSVDESNLIAWSDTHPQNNRFGNLGMGGGGLGGFSGGGAEGAIDSQFSRQLILESNLQPIQDSAIAEKPAETFDVETLESVQSPMRKMPQRMEAQPRGRQILGQPPANPPSATEPATPRAAAPAKASIESDAQPKLAMAPTRAEKFETNFHRFIDSLLPGQSDIEKKLKEIIPQAGIDPIAQSKSSPTPRSPTPEKGQSLSRQSEYEKMENAKPGAVALRSGSRSANSTSEGKMKQDRADIPEGALGPQVEQRPPLMVARGMKKPSAGLRVTPAPAGPGKSIGKSAVETDGTPFSGIQGESGGKELASKPDMKSITMSKKESSESDTAKSDRIVPERPQEVSKAPSKATRLGVASQSAMEMKSIGKSQTVRNNKDSSPEVPRPTNPSRSDYTVEKRRENEASPRLTGVVPSGPLGRTDQPRAVELTRKQLLRGGNQSTNNDGIFAENSQKFSPKMSRNEPTSNSDKLSQVDGGTAEIQSDLAETPGRRQVAKQGEYRQDSLEDLTLSSSNGIAQQFQSRSNQAQRDFSANSEFARPPGTNRDRLWIRNNDLNFGVNNYSLQIGSYANGRRQAEPQTEVRAGEVVSTLDDHRSLVRARLANDAEFILGPKSQVILLRPTALQLQVGEMELNVPEGDQIDLYGPSIDPHNPDFNPIGNEKLESNSTRSVSPYGGRGLQPRFRMPPQIVTGRKVFRVENNQAVVLEPAPRWLVDFRNNPIHNTVTNSLSGSALTRQPSLPTIPAAEVDSPTKAPLPAGPQ